MARRKPKSKSISKTLIDSAKFGQRFELMIDRLWTIQDRIAELKEFEKQWGELFLGLKKKTGAECSVRIANSGVYRSFHWDKYQILVSDLLSFCHNELDEANDSAVIKQVIHHLKLLGVEDYLDPNLKINFIHNPRFPMTDEDKQKRTDERRLESAKERLKYTKEALKSLFPRIDDDHVIRDTDIRSLLKQISSEAKKIIGIRNYFNHKYEDAVTAKYEGSLKGFSLNKIEEITDRLFDLASSIGFIRNHTSYAKNDHSHQPEIEDQIDLILFGSIKTAIFNIYENQDRDKFYWEAREAYFFSDAMVALVVSK